MKSRGSSLRLGVEQLETRDTPTTLTTSVRDAFGPTGFTPGWTETVQRNGVDVPLSGYHAGLVNAANTQLVGVEGPSRIETQTVTPLFNYTLLNNGGTIKFHYENMPASGAQVRLRWEGGTAQSPTGNGFSTTLSGTGDVTVDLPWFVNEKNAFVYMDHPMYSGGYTPSVYLFTYVQGHVVNTGSNPSTIGMSQFAYQAPVAVPGTSMMAGTNIGTTTAQGPVGLQWNPNRVLVRPGQNEPVTLGWTAPNKGLVTLRTMLKDAEPLAGDGVTYRITRTTTVYPPRYPRGFVGPRETVRDVTTVVGEGLLPNGASKNEFFGGKELLVNQGDRLRLQISPKGNQQDGLNNLGDATDVDWTIRLEDEPTRLARTSADKVETQAVIPTVEVWGQGSQVKIRYQDVPDMGIDVRIGQQTTVHIDQGSGTKTVALPVGYTGNPMNEASLWVERSDTHAAVTKNFPIDMRGGWGSTLRATALPQGPIPLLPLAQSRVIVTKNTDVQKAIRGELQSLLDGRPSIREALSLNASDILSLSDRAVAKMNLNDLGGVATLTSWIGGPNAGSAIVPETAAYWTARYLLLKKMEADPAGSLVQSANLPNNLWMDAPYWPTHNKTVNIPGFGPVTITSDDGTPQPSTGLTGYSTYMGVQNNVIASSGYGPTVNGVPMVSQFGKHWLRFTFPTPVYIRSLSMAHLGGTRDGSVTFKVPIGTQYTIPLDGSGEIPLNSLVTSFTINPGPRSAYGLQGISNHGYTGAAVNCPQQEWRVTGSAATVDFSQSETLVSRVSGRLLSERPGDVFTVKALRGTGVVQMMNVASDGSFLLEDAKGITGLIISHSHEAGTFGIGDLLAEGERGAIGLSVRSLSPQTSTDLAQLTKPEYESGAQWPVGYSQLIQQYGVVTQANPNNTSGGWYYVMGANDVNRYTLHRTIAAGGSSIEGIYAFTEQGMIEVPSHLYARTGGNSIVTFPGSPQHLVFRMRWTGVLAGISADAGDKFDQVAPPEQMSLSANILNLSPQPVSVPGFGSPVFQINQPSYAHLTPGTAVGMLAQITNMGQTGGLVTAKVYCGYNGDERDPLQGTFSANFAPGEIRSLSCTAGAPGGQPSDARAVITIILETPNGTVRTEYKAPVYRSSEYRVWDTAQQKLVWVDPPLSAADARNVNRRQMMALSAAQNSGSSNVAMLQAAVNASFSAWQTTLAKENQALADLLKVNQLIAQGQSGPTGEQLAKMNTDSLHSAPYGSVLGVNYTTQLVAMAGVSDSLMGQVGTTLRWNQQAFQNALSWYTSRSQILGLGELPIDESSAMGKLFLAILQGTQGIISAANQTEFNAKVIAFANVLPVGTKPMPEGLDISRLAKVLRGTEYPELDVYADVNIRRVQGLKKLFEEGQMGHIFALTQTGPIPSISKVSTNKFYGPGSDTYRNYSLSQGQPADEYITVRFDVPASRIPYVRAVVELLDHNGNLLTMTNGQRTLSAEPLGNMSFRIPLSQITALMGTDHIQDAGRDYHRNPQTGAMRNTFRLALRSYQTNTSGEVGVQTLSMNEFQVEVAGVKYLSVRNQSDPLYGPETKFLSGMQSPLETNNWYYNMESSRHADTGLYAIDFNLPGSTDKDKPVTVATTGKLKDINLADGKVVIESVVDGRTFWTIYYHMTHILEDLSGIQYLGVKEADAAGVDAATANTQRALAESSLRALIGTELKAGGSLAKVGTEGDSSNFHLHFSGGVFVDGKLTPVNLFHWSDSIQKGFPVSGIIGGKNMTVSWQDGVNAMGNATEGIIMDRVNIYNASNVVTGAENRAYSWDLNSNNRRRLKWNGDTAQWCEVNSDNEYVIQNGMKNIWRKNPATGLFEFIWQ